MANKTGIRQWSEQRLISGARVAFDPRRTDQVDNSRDANNYRTSERFARMARREARIAEERSGRRQTA